jgi:hypothetical protein
MTTTISDTELDEMVKRARKITGETETPDSSAVRTLSEFSRMTTSLEELVLFIEYQGSRQSKAKQDFFSATAKATKELANGDIGKARRFLAILVRAAAIKHKSGPVSNQRGRGGR